MRNWQICTSEGAVILELSGDFNAAYTKAAQLWEVIYHPGQEIHCNGLSLWEDISPAYNGRGQVRNLRHRLDLTH